MGPMHHSLLHWRWRTILYGHDGHERIRWWGLGLTGCVVLGARDDELEHSVVNVVRHGDRAIVTIGMGEDLSWQLEWGSRVRTDVFEGPRSSSI